MSKSRSSRIAVVCFAIATFALALTASGQPGARSIKFVEAEFDEMGGVDGLDMPFSVAMSPDGRHAYVAGYRDSAVAVFSISAANGALSFVERVKDDVGGVDGLGGTFSVSVSPDGRHVYAAGYDDDALAVFSRNSGSGALTFVESVKDEVNGVDGLNGARHVSVNPTGTHVYGTGLSDDAIAVFSRDPNSGVLTFVEAEFDGVNGVTGIDGAYFVLFSPDGKHVYVAGVYADAIAAFSRHSTTGALTFIEAVVDEMAGVDGLDGVGFLALSGDGRYVYASGYGDDEIALFSRNPATGELTFVEVTRDGVGGVNGLDGPRGITVSPSGRHVFVAGVVDDSVAMFARDAISGSLVFVEVELDGVNGADGLNEATDVAVSPDGNHVYVVGAADDALATFAVSRLGIFEAELPNKCAVSVPGRR